METKICKICLIEKELSEFRFVFRKDGRKNNYRNECKACESEYNKKYREINNKKISINDKERRENNKESISEYNKKYREENKEYYIKYNQKEKEKERKRIWRENNKEYYKSYQEENKEKLKEKHSNWYQNNKSSVKQRVKKYFYNKLKTNDLFKLHNMIRNSISQSIKKMGYTKKSRTYEILGITYEEFKIYIENLFQEGMSWKNYGKWHLDHKTPISWAKTEEEVYKLNHYTNFQPLWACDNISKGNRYKSE